MAQEDFNGMAARYAALGFTDVILVVARPGDKKGIARATNMTPNRFVELMENNTNQVLDAMVKTSGLRLSKTVRRGRKNVG